MNRILVNVQTRRRKRIFKFIYSIARLVALKFLVKGFVLRSTASLIISAAKQLREHNCILVLKSNVLIEKQAHENIQIMSEDDVLSGSAPRGALQIRISLRIVKMPLYIRSLITLTLYVR